MQQHRLFFPPNISLCIIVSSWLGDLCSSQITYCIYFIQLLFVHACMTAAQYIQHTSYVMFLALELRHIYPISWSMNVVTLRCVFAFDVLHTVSGSSLSCTYIRNMLEYIPYEKKLIKCHLVFETLFLFFLFTWSDTVGFTSFAHGQSLPPPTPSPSCSSRAYPLVNGCSRTLCT